MSARLARIPARAMRFAKLFGRAMQAAGYGREQRIPGMVFDSFGRLAGLHVALRGQREGLSMMLVPVSIVRYWEFPFVLRHLPGEASRALDVASPRLFSYYALQRDHVKRVRMINPDSRDAGLTTDLAASLGIRNLTVDELTVAQTQGETVEYDAAWSISVIEHIPEDGDIEAVEVMWTALRPGGRLILTVPVDRTAWDEYREHDEYELGVPQHGRGFFFQRWYDERALRSRLLSRFGDAHVSLEWFGERVAGHFEEYERQWMALGFERTVEDAREIADHYRVYPDWASMPGRGVVGIAVEKP